MMNKYAIEVLKEEEEDLKEKIMPMSDYDGVDNLMYEHRKELMATRKKKLVVVQSAIKQLRSTDKVIASGKVDYPKWEGWNIGDFIIGKESWDVIGEKVYEAYNKGDQIEVILRVK